MVRLHVTVAGMHVQLDELSKPVQLMVTGAATGSVARSCGMRLLRREHNVLIIMNVESR